MKINSLSGRWVFFLLVLAHLPLLCYQFGGDRGDSHSASLFQTNKSNLDKLNSINDKCFCKLTGDVDDCDCKIDYIDKFNNYKIQPLVKYLMQRDYFRFIRVNLKKICQFWHDDAKCSLKDCHVKFCDEEELPENFKNHFNKDYDGKSGGGDCEQENPLGHLNESLTDENLKTFEDWKKYDEAQDNFCEPDDENLTKADYTDLVRNPERFTGYKGPHAHKIWNSIYRENCFQNNEKRKPSYSPEPEETCLEKRIFYRLISGLHTSINVHLCASYLHKGVLNQPDYWGPNVEEFKRRFDPSTTNNQGPQWLKNLYFIYLVELRALKKAAPYFEKESFYAGQGNDEDKSTKLGVLKFLNATK